MLCKILRLFVNTLWADDKYFLVNRQKLTEPIQILLSSKQKTFSEFFSTFLISTLNFEHFQKKVTVIGDFIPKLRTSKKVITWMSAKSCFWGLFNKQHGKRIQTLLESRRQHLYHIYWSLWTYFSWKKTILALCNILRLFVNTLWADDKYFLVNRDKLTQPSQILLP